MYIYTTLIHVLILCLRAYFLCTACTSSQAQHKVLPGEDSIDLIEYNRKLSRASSSGSSHERVPASGRHREDSTDSGRVAELQAKYEEEMIRLTEKLSAAEDATEQLRKENQKLIRKLADAEEVTEQSEVATIEVHVHFYIFM